jgi:hypothetical protein
MLEVFQLTAPIGEKKLLTGHFPRRRHCRYSRYSRPTCLKLVWVSIGSGKLLDEVEKPRSRRRRRRTRRKRNVQCS